MKQTLMFLTITMILVFAVTTSAFAWGSKNATGEITSLNHSSGAPGVTVQGYTEGGKLWLGFSYKCKGDRSWRDVDPKKVKGKFTKTFYMNLCPQGYSEIRSCLWKGKDGGFMEGRVDCYDY